ncbi:MAG: SLC13 family permease [Bacteroidales bacterium]|nr:SLC13 family permease [Bacteroidales bacterium]
MITFDIILVFIAIVFILYSLYTELFGPAFTFMLAILFLGLFNVLTPREILEGFGNEQVAVILLLLALGDIIRKTAIIEMLFDRMFRSARSYNGFLSRMMLIVATFSSVLNNTPLVAIMMPYVHNWCKRNKYSPSRFLIPLSYAAILGGSVTLIGTSTNLIVAGMLESQTIIPGIQELQMFDFVYVGIPMVLIGFLYILLIGKKLLPERSDTAVKSPSGTRKYFIEARIRRGSYLIGKKIGETNLRNLKGLILVEIIRDTNSIQAYHSEIIIHPDDILVFAGDTQNIADLVETESGLVVPEVGMLSKAKKAEVIEIVVSQNSTLIGKEVHEVNFRAKYDAAVLAVHRNGEHISSKMGNVELRAGDVLLMYAGAAFDSRIQMSQDFYFISRVKDFVKIENYKVYLLLGGLLVAILLSALNILALFKGLLILMVMAMILKITNPKDLPKSLDYNLALIIVLSLALATAMTKTRAAELLAEGIISIFMPLGKVGVLFGVYFITTVLAAYITNKASVGIIFPIAITVASNLNVSAIPFVLTVAYGAAANFMTPIGYQTNLMVYGPGNYSFKDFFKIGAPLTVLYMVTTVLILYAIYF